MGFSSKGVGIEDFDKETKSTNKERSYKKKLQGNAAIGL